MKTTRRRWFGLGRNNKGSVLLLVMIAAPVAAALFFSLIEMVLISKRQTIINRNVVSYSAVMDSVLDYTNYAIKNRWCMTDTWSRDTTNCNLSHPRSFERMTLDQSAITALRDINANNGGFTTAATVLDEIDIVFNVSDLINDHPLTATAMNLQAIGKAVTQIGVKVKRVNNVNVPRRGREVYLDVKVTLMSGSVIFRNLSAISATSRLMLTPRELNYFSLVVPKDMYLDGRTTTDNGDFTVPAGSGGSGISFESPVFVNGDVYIPNASAAYTSATFSNKVILGGPNSAGRGGRIMQGAAPYTAASTGQMSSYLYSVMPGFGGFKKGVDVDGVRDSGLDVLAGYSATSSNPSAAAANQCIGINKIYHKLQETRKSDLVFKYIPTTPPANTSEYVFNIGFTQGNMFANQQLVPAFVGHRAPQPRGKLFDLKENTSSFWSLDKARSTMYVRFDSGSDLSNLGSGKDDPVGNQFTEQFLLRPFTKASMLYSAMVNTKDGPVPKKAWIEIQLDPITAPGTPEGQYERSVAQLKISSHGYQNPATIQYFSIYIKGYDLGFFSGRQLRVTLPEGDPNSTQVPGHSTEGWLYFKLVGGKPGDVGVKSENGVLQLINADGTDADMTTFANYRKSNDSKPTYPKDFVVPTYNPPAVPPILAVSPSDIPGTSQLPNENFPYQALVSACTSDSGGSNSAAFKAIGWDSPFVNTTRYSWHFAPADLNLGDANAENIGPTKDYETIPASGASASLVINSDQFYVKSIIGNCIIPATTSVAAGFITCDNLIIQPRTTPLMMIGTFIVGKANIDPSAMANGITFRSIYHPQSLSTLSAAGMMKDFSGNTCSTPLSFPIWWPNLSSTQYDTFRKCNVISLRDKANPFTWSSVNPDCGVSSASNFTQCQKHTLNYILSEISRISELQ